MARIARVAVPSAPHHVAGRGNRRMNTFSPEEDHPADRDLMSVWRRMHGVESWADIPMTSHAHLITMLDSEAGLAARPRAADAMANGGGGRVRRPGAPGLGPARPPLKPPRTSPTASARQAQRR